jgi:lipid-binding SYLF domain-containing protein
MISLPRAGSAPLARTRFPGGCIAAVALAALALAGCQQGSGNEQTLVDRATLTVQELMSQKVSENPQYMLRRAKGAMICPRVFKAGFFVGGEGGSCVLLARSGNGTWSYPTFYDIGSGSFGFQFGVQDSQLILLIMTTRGLNAVMDSQVRLGGNVSIAVASVGAGVQGSTTAAVGADIIAFAEARGLFGGVSLEGGVMSARVDENQSYYGQPLAPRQIVLQMQGVNPGADPLREILTRYGSAEGTYQGPPAGGGYQPPPGQQGYGPGYAPGYQGPPPGQPSYPPPAFQPPPDQQAYPPAYQPRQAPQGYQPPPVQPYQQPPPAYAPPPRPQAASPGYAPQQPRSGYQPPPGQYTYPPPSGGGPIQEQSLPPPGQ